MPAPSVAESAAESTSTRSNAARFFMPAFFRRRGSVSNISPELPAVPESTAGSDPSSSGKAEYVDRERLQDDLVYRVQWMKAFLGWKEEDGRILNMASPLVTPLIAKIVDGVYAHLFQWTYTKEPFLPPSGGFRGKVADSLEGLSLDSPIILFRKKFLQTYLRKIFDADYNDPRTYEYLDRVGQMHNGLPGFKHREKKTPLHVDLMACSLLIGWVQDVLLTAVFQLTEQELPAVDKLAFLRAFNRIMWIQNDLFQRHYVRDDEEADFHRAAGHFAR